MHSLCICRTMGLDQRQCIVVTVCMTKNTSLPLDHAGLVGYAFMNIGLLGGI